MKRPLPAVSAKDQRALDSMNPGKWDQIAAVIIGVDSVVFELEAVWGTGRLVRLVSDQTRLGFQRGHGLWTKAIASNDLEAIRTIGPKMIAAWQFMAKEADGRGHAPLSPEVFEARLPDGRVLAVVKTNAEAIAISRSDRAMVVYSMTELARVVPSLELVNAIKESFPGSLVDKVTTHSESFGEAWATSSDFLELHEMAEVG